MLQELLEEETDLNKQWQNIKETWTSTCQEVVGPRTPQQKEWISVETLRKVQMRKEKKTAVNNSRTRTAKAKAQEEYAEVNREVKKSIKVDKRNYIDSLAEEAEQAAGRGNMKELYDTTRKLSGKYCHPERPVKDKEGNAIIGNEQQLDRWAEHFEELLNRPAPPNPPVIHPAEDDLPINCDRPAREEIKKAIQQLKNNKASGPDDIPAEALKAVVDTSVELLYPLFGKIWKRKKCQQTGEKATSSRSPRKETSEIVLTTEGSHSCQCQGKSSTGSSWKG